MLAETYLSSQTSAKLSEQNPDAKTRGDLNKIRIEIVGFYYRSLHERLTANIGIEKI